MPTASLQDNPSPWQRFHDRWLGTGRWQATILVLTAIVGFISWSPRLGDFGGYLLVGRAVLDGADIYQGKLSGINTWPPFFSLVCVPLALIARISSYLATSLWLLLNYRCLLLVLDLLARIIHGRPMTLRRTGAGLSITAPELFLPLLLPSTYLFNNFEHAQINLILLGLTLGALYLLETGRIGGGALALGLAIAMKVTPVLFLPYLAYRRAWRALLASTAAAAAISLTPIAVFGWTRFREYLATWRRVIDSSTAAGALNWGSSAQNQSIYAMWDRWIGHHVYPFAPGSNYYLATSGNPAVKIAWAATLAIIGLLALRQFRSGPATAPRVAAAEWSVVLLISALAGPVAWKFYLVVLLVPHALLVAVWRRPDLGRGDRRVVGWVIGISAFLSLLTAHSLIGNEPSAQLELGSVGTLSGLVMLGGVLWLRGRPDLLTGPDTPVSIATE